MLKQEQNVVRISSPRAFEWTQKKSASEILSITACVSGQQSVRQKGVFASETMKTEQPFHVYVVPVIFDEVDDKLAEAPIPIATIAINGKF